MLCGRPLLIAAVLDVFAAHGVPRRYFSSVLGLVSPSPPMAEAVADGINSELNDRVTHIVTAHNAVHDKDVEND